MRNDAEAVYKAHKPLLFSLAYRLLGSVTDAEDMVHEAILKYGETAEGRPIENVRAYLCRVVTNLCINRLQSARQKRESYFGPWLPEPLVDVPLEGDPHQRWLQRDSLTTAYLLLLEKLTPAERAVFLLREVYAFGYDEIAEMVGKNPANCRKVFSRAKAKFSGQSGPLSNPQAEGAGPPDGLAAQAAAAGVIERFLNALHSGDIQKTLELLSDQAVLISDGGGRVHAAPKPIFGADRVARFLIAIAGKAPAATSVRVTTVNGAPGLVVSADGQPTHVISFSYARDRIAAVYIVANPEKLAHVRPVP